MKAPQGILTKAPGMVLEYHLMKENFWTHGHDIIAGFCPDFDHLAASKSRVTQQKSTICFSLGHIGFSLFFLKGRLHVYMYTYVIQQQNIEPLHFFRAGFIRYKLQWEVSLCLLKFKRFYFFFINLNT